MSSSSLATSARRRKARFPPGPPNRLFAMLFGALQQDPLGYFTDLTRQYGDVWGMRIGNFRSFFINHPDLIEDVLVNKAKLYHKGRILQANKYLFGEGLLTAEGDFWLRQRRLAQPAFHRERIAAYAATMADYTEQMLATWRNGEERDVHQEMMNLALRIVGKTLFDSDVTRDESARLWTCCLKSHRTSDGPSWCRCGCRRHEICARKRACGVSRKSFTA